MPEGISFEHILVLATSVAYGHWASLVSDSGTYGALRSSAQCPGEPGPSPVRPRHRDPSGSLGVHSWCIQKIFHHFHMFEHNCPLPQTSLFNRSVVMQNVHSVILTDFNGSLRSKFCKTELFIYVATKKITALLSLKGKPYPTKTDEFSKKFQTFFDPFSILGTD